MLIYDINQSDGTVINTAGRDAPADPMRQTPRIPAGATDIAPPSTGEHEAARWAGDDWEVVPDYRGHVYYTDDGERHEITELGIEPPVDALDEAPPESLADVAAKKKREIESARDAAIDDGFTHTFGDTDDVVQTRQRDRENLTGLAVSAQRHPDKTFQFRAKSNATYELTADDMLALADAAQDHVSEQYGKSWQLKAQVDSALEAEDREGLEAIEWSNAE
ncbi:DUF4376 domain-containing protein [Vreelandella maris]|uniref:DUF4376 domain-containing protein n=1 Tax=Vreelandella maris TaxID=2729617 RepID=A0A7Y6RFG1_9GAMM|nr:DUF4376 domain-containing protein [Halomonas maris]NVF16009.1 DUF4376 domain-containing protein [Halomonas maris]